MKRMTKYDVLTVLINLNNIYYLVSAYRTLLWKQLSSSRLVRCSLTSGIFLHSVQQACLSTLPMKLWTLDVKVKGKAKVASSHAMEAQMGSRGIAVHFLNLSPRQGGWSTPWLGRLTLVPTVQEARWDPGPVRTDMERRESLASTAVRTRNHPGHSE